LNHSSRGVRSVRNQRHRTPGQRPQINPGNTNNQGSYTYTSGSWKCKPSEHPHSAARTKQITLAGNGCRMKCSPRNITAVAADPDR